jgi:hypothetical protein
MIRSATLITHGTSKDAYIHRQDEACNSELTQKLDRIIDNVERAIQNDKIKMEELMKMRKAQIRIIERSPLLYFIS